MEVGLDRTQDGPVIPAVDSMRTGDEEGQVHLLIFHIELLFQPGEALLQLRSTVKAVCSNLHLRKMLALCTLLFYFQSHLYLVEFV